VWASRLKEFAAMISIGDGVLALIAPRNHVALWLLGPKRLRKLTLWFAENPTYTRLGGIAEIGLGIWLALRHYQKAAPQPWYQRWFSQYRLLPAWLAPVGLLALVLLTVTFMRTTRRSETASEEDQAAREEELAAEEEVAQESRKDIRNIIRESLRRSRRQQ
jgi:type VI protein secretion system component VasK